MLHGASIVLDGLPRPSIATQDETRRHGYARGRNFAARAELQRLVSDPLSDFNLVTHGALVDVDRHYSDFQNAR